MFFEKNLLTRRGKFGVIWIAATRPAGLKKHDYVTVNVRQQCTFLMEHIVQRRVAGRSNRGHRKMTEAEKQEELAKFSLYLSAQLMYGVVRVFAQQHIILLQDVNSAMLTFSFHGGVRQSAATGGRAAVAGRGAGRASSALNVNDDAVIEPRMNDEAELLLLQHVNTPFALNLFPEANFEVTTDLGTTIHPHELTPPEQNNPFNAPIDENAHGGMDPVDPFELLGLRTDGMFFEDPQPQQMEEPFMIIAESEQFVNDYSNVLAEKKKTSGGEEEEPKKDGPAIPVENDENVAPGAEEAAPSRRKSRAKAKAARVIVDQIESVSQAGRVPPKYAPENRYAKHNFTFKSNFPTHAWNIDPDLAEIYFSNRAIEASSLSAPQVEVVEGVPNLNEATISGISNVPLGASNQSMEEARAGSLRSSHSSSARISSLLRGQKRAGSAISGAAVGVEMAPLEFEEPQMIFEQPPPSPVVMMNSSSYSRSFASNPLIEDPVNTINSWMAASDLHAEECFSTFCPSDLTTRAQAANAFLALFFHSKNAKLSLRQDDCYGEIFFEKIA